MVPSSLLATHNSGGSVASAADSSITTRLPSSFTPDEPSPVLSGSPPPPTCPIPAGCPAAFTRDGRPPVLSGSPPPPTCAVTVLPPPVCGQFPSQAGPVARPASGGAAALSDPDSPDEQPPMRNAAASTRSGRM